MVSKISDLTSARPPTSSHETFGILGAPIASARDVRALVKACSKSPLAMGSPTCTALEACSLKAGLMTD